MRILLVHNATIPVVHYGGIERVIWALGKELNRLGLEVTYLVPAGSTCDFAKVLPLKPDAPIAPQIPVHTDLVHFHFEPKGLEHVETPYLITQHGNMNEQRKLDINTVFVSRNHAERFGSDSFVYNGLDWEAYQKPDMNTKRSYFHFLGNAAWRVKNVKGAIETVLRTPDERLHVIGGVRFNVNMGLRLTISPRIHFHGNTGGDKKDKIKNHSKGFVFPVRWHEPFGLAIIESLYFGCPVFGTPYGSLPELVPPDMGFLSNSSSALAAALVDADEKGSAHCHAYARDLFSSGQMTKNYLECYDKVLAGKTLNEKSPVLKEVATERFLPWHN